MNRPQNVTATPTQGRTVSKSSNRNASQSRHNAPPPAPVVESEPVPMPAEDTSAVECDTDGPDPWAAIKGQLAEREVKPHLRCPICWNGNKGRAKRRKWSRQVSGTLTKRCYVCNECGREWVVDVRSEIVDDVEIVTTGVSQVRNP